MHFFKAWLFVGHPELAFKFSVPSFPSVVSTPNVCGGSPRLIRTRIPVWLLQQMRVFRCQDPCELPDFDGGRPRPGVGICSRIQGRDRQRNRGE
jgi:hypothetical protein